jgi:hypothetical protein
LSFLLAALLFWLKKEYNSTIGYENNENENRKMKNHKEKSKNIF